MLQQINSIFIFDFDKNQRKEFVFEHTKFIGIYTELDSLYSSIQEQIELDDELFRMFSFFDQSEYSTQDLSKQISDLFWFQLVNNIILQYSHNQLAKNEMIDLCRQYYQDNLNNLKVVDEFEHEYHSNKFSQWFLKRSFPYKMIKKALQIKDLDQLNTLRYFMNDLIQCFSSQPYNTVQYENENLIIYRGTKLSKEQLDEFRKNQGKLLLNNGFLTATRSHSNALNFAKKLAKQINVVAAILEIECKSKDFDKNIIFTDRDKSKDLSNQDDVLFNLNVMFHLDKIEFHENIWIIKLSTSNEGEIILEKYIEDTRQQTENLSIELIFGRLMLDMGQWNQSQKYFKRLLIDSNDKNQAWIEYSLGEIHHLNGEWIVARKYYNCAYDRMMNPKQMYIKESAQVLSNIGELLYGEGKFEEAMNFHERALQIRKEYYSSDHPHIANSLRNIGDIFYKQDKYDEAFIYFQEALTILEKYYNNFHVDIAKCLSSIGHYFREQRNYDKSLESHRRSSAIYEKYYPYDHVCIVLTLNNIADILCGQDKNDEALHTHRRALTMHKQFFQFDHIDISKYLGTLALAMEEKYYPSFQAKIAQTFMYIGEVLRCQEKYEEALDHYKQALMMQKNYYPLGHVNIAFTLQNTGIILSQQGKYDEALEFYHQASIILEKHGPYNRSDIAFNLIRIGHILNNQEKFDEALNVLRRALEIRETHCSSNHLQIAHNLNDIEIRETFDPSDYEGIVVMLSKISHVLKQEKRYDDALSFLYRALNIRETHLPSTYAQIARNINSIGLIHYEQENYNEAREYYERALEITETFNASAYDDIAVLLSNISLTYKRQEDYVESLDFRNRSLEIRETHLLSNHLQIADDLHELGHILLAQIEYNKALSPYKRGLEMRETFDPSEYENIACLLTSISDVLKHQQKLDEALDFQNQPLKILETHCPTSHIYITPNLNNIGNILRQQGKYDEARDNYQKVLAICEEFYSSDYKNILVCLGNNADVFEDQEKYDQALLYRQ
ncbi:unnamed protein product [Rotaria sordida]|uniref:Uncharacterized protein n=1 Tax=Rotaria sordida TaxID=392033 RepID=A0A819SIK0_9BILA|nr:unnamed protein product [Rotaria sordida]